MSRDSIELCPDNCRKYHTKEFVAEQLAVSLRQLYRYIERGLKVSELGAIYCPWIREFLHRDVTICQDPSQSVSESLPDTPNR